MILLTDIFHHRSPVASEGGCLEMAVKVGYIDCLDLIIFDYEILVELLADIVVRDTEDGRS